MALKIDDVSPGTWVLDFNWTRGMGNLGPAVGFWLVCLSGPVWARRVLAVGSCCYPPWARCVLASYSCVAACRGLAVGSPPVPAARGMAVRRGLHLPA